MAAAGGFRECREYPSFCAEKRSLDLVTLSGDFYFSSGENQISAFDFHPHQPKSAGAMNKQSIDDSNTTAIDVIMLSCITVLRY